jgi:hypothetical protein
MMRIPARPATPWVWVGILYSALALMNAWPLLLHFNSGLPNDIGDPGLNTWILWWNARAIPLTAHWWNAPIFYPMQGAFALSESLIAISLVTTPLQWMGIEPVAAHNAAFFLSSVSAALSGHALGHQLTKRHDAALLAGLAYGFCPYRAAQIPHVQVLVSCWMPLALLYFHRYLEGRKVRDLGFAGAAWTLNGLTNGYFLFFFAVLFSGWVVWFARRWRDALALVLTATLASLPLAPLLLGYYRWQRTFDLSRGLGEIEFFSADITALWSSARSLWWAGHWTIAPRPEGELYPGLVVVALALVAIGYTVRRDFATTGGAEPEPRMQARLRRILLALGGGLVLVGLASLLTGGWTISLAGATISTTHPFKTFTSATWVLLTACLMHPRTKSLWRTRSSVAFYPLAAAVMFILAMGPTPHAFGVPIFYKAPYAWLMALPGGSSFRVPARFEMLVMLCLAAAAALTYARIAAPHRRPALLSALAALIVLDGWMPKMRVEDVPSKLNLPALPATLPLLQLPAGNIYPDATAMLQSIDHGHPLVNGHSGYWAPHYFALREGLASYDADVVEVLREYGDLAVAIDTARDEGGNYRRMMSTLSGAAPIEETPGLVVYRLPRRSADAASSPTAMEMRAVLMKEPTLGQR